MKLILLAGALFLAGCATIPEATVATAVERAIAAEKVVAARCLVSERTALEVQLHNTARFTFIARYGALMVGDQRSRYEAAMRQTNDDCAVTH